MHRANAGNLLDLNSPKNLMHAFTGVGHDELRFKPQPKYYAPFGDENQWNTIPR